MFQAKSEQSTGLTKDDSEDDDSWSTDANNNCRPFDSSYHISTKYSMPYKIQNVDGDEWYENNLKRCNAQTSLVYSDNLGGEYDDLHPHVGVTQSLENFNNISHVGESVCEVQAKTPFQTSRFNRTPKAATQARRKSFEFEDIAQLKTYNQWLGGKTYRNVLKYGTSLVSQKTEDRRAVAMDSEISDIMYDNPFDPRLQHDRPTIVKQQNLSLFTPLRHVTNSNVFLDVAERISKVMEEYTTNHRSKIVEEIDDKTFVRPSSASNEKIDSDQNVSTTHRKVSPSCMPLKSCRISLCTTHGCRWRIDLITI